MTNAERGSRNDFSPLPLLLLLSLAPLRLCARQSFSLARSLTLAQGLPASRRAQAGPRSPRTALSLCSSPLPCSCFPWCLCASARDKAFLFACSAFFLGSAFKLVLRSSACTRNVADKLPRYTSPRSYSPTAAHVPRERCAFPSSHSAFRVHLGKEHCLAQEALHVPVEGFDGLYFAKTVSLSRIEVVLVFDASALQ